MTIDQVKKVPVDSISAHNPGNFKESFIESRVLQDMIKWIHFGGISVVRKAVLHDFPGEHMEIDLLQSKFRNSEGG